MPSSAGPSDPDEMPVAGSFLADRRKALLFGGAAVFAGIAGGAWRLGAQTLSQPADWPSWAPSLREHYRRVDDLRSGAVDIRRFGAAADGVTDDSRAFRQALASGARAILLPANATIALASAVSIDRPVAILGSESGSGVRLVGEAKSLFEIRPAAPDPGQWVKDCIFDSISFSRPSGSGGAAITAYNIRGLRVSRCRSDGLNLAVVRHMRQLLNLYSRRKGSLERDPAIVAGFNASGSDLNEDILICDNQVDYGRYQGAILRFEFARRVTVFNNDGRFAKISWWGGGARISEGGALEHLRRVRDVYIADNRLHGANGGVYGNNGQNVVVARNVIRDMTDVGVDFEGCLDCLAYNNDVRNVGNFCYATFYAAANIVFRDNYGEQNGSGATLHERFGRGRYGAPKGIYLAALRSANFAKVRDAITVSFLNNRFVWTGRSGFGACAPSFFEELELRGNVFDNVVCDWTFRQTHTMRAIGNVFRFDRAPEAAQAILSSSAAEFVAQGNRFDLPQGIGTQLKVLHYTSSYRTSSALIERNTATAGKAGIALHAERRPKMISLQGNSVDSLTVSGDLPPNVLRLDGNFTAQGRAISVQRTAS